MSDVLQGLHTGAGAGRRLVRPLGIFAPWRLHAYGLTMAALYAVLIVALYRSGAWLVDSSGVPTLNDFTNAWLAGAQALHGQAVSLYDPGEYARIQASLVGPKEAFYRNWPYPPTFFLVLAPFALIPYVYAFIAWTMATLLCCGVVVYLIVRRLPAVTLLLACPFTPWNLCAGQNGLLTGSLLGTSLLLLERRPVLSGVFMGCLSYKPQFGVLLPMALLASSRWRAFGSAAATVACLVAASLALFGRATWEGFPIGLSGQYADYLTASGDAGPLAVGGWGRLQTVYGLVRDLHGDAALAWLAQGITAAGAAIVTWLVWGSPARYVLQAATLSAAALITMPYAFTYDMAVIAIPVAFLASDQISCGLLRGEQTIMIGPFGACLVIVVSLGNIPLGPIVIIVLLAMILRRALRQFGKPRLGQGTQRRD